MGEAKKRTARAMSSGWPGRCRGVVRLNMSRAAATVSSGTPVVEAGVIAAPGDTALTRIPDRPHSSARVFVRWISPALAAPYAEWFGAPKTPLIDVTFTIAPPPDVSMAGIAERHSQKMYLRFRCTIE